MQCVFWGLGSDGTVGANKNSIKIIGEETDQLCAGLLRLRLEESRLGDHLPPALRTAPHPRAYLIRPGRLRRLPPVHLPRAVSIAARCANPAASSCWIASMVPTRSGSTCRARSRRAIVAKRLKLLRDRRPQGGRRTGMGGRINTVMQTCFFALSGVLPRDEAISQSSAASRRRMASAARPSCSRTSRRWIRRSPICTKSDPVQCAWRPCSGGSISSAVGVYRQSFRRRPAQCRPTAAVLQRRPPVPAAAPEFVRRRPRPDDRRRGRCAASERPARRRHLSLRDRALGEAQPRRRDSRLGSASSASSAESASWSARTRSSARRSTTPPASPGRRTPSSRWMPRYREFPGMKYTLQSLAGRLHGLHALRRRMPRQGQAPGRAQGHQHGAAAAAARARGGQLGVLPRGCPRSSAAI